MVEHRNIQIIEGAKNSTFDIYQVPKNLFDVMFPNSTDIAFLDEVQLRLNTSIEFGVLDEVMQWGLVYRHKVDKKKVSGIDGTLHITGSFCEPEYFPTRKEVDVIETS